MKRLILNLALLLSVNAYTEEQVEKKEKQRVDLKKYAQILTQQGKKAIKNIIGIFSCAAIVKYITDLHVEDIESAQGVPINNSLLGLYMDNKTSVDKLKAAEEVLLYLRHEKIMNVGDKEMLKLRQRIFDLQQTTIYPSKSVHPVLDAIAVAGLSYMAWNFFIKPTWCWIHKNLEEKETEL
jgi:hypothetical protein